MEHVGGAHDQPASRSRSHHEVRRRCICIAIARLECHYSFHGAFFGPDTALLDGVPRIRHLPATIVHGRYDVICPLDNAWALHRAWPNAKLEVVADAGHSAFEPGIVHQLVEATDCYAR